MIEQQREEKATHLQPYQPAKVEKALDFIEDDKVLQRLTGGYHGLNLQFGGLVQGSGFALGPEYRLGSESSYSNLRVGAQLSTKLYQKYYVRWTLPKIAQDHFSFDFNAVHRNYSQIDYFGPGPRSLKSNRTNYRLEDTAIDAALGVKPMRHVQLGGSAGYLAVNIGPGQSDSFPSTDQIFPASIVTGIDHQTNAGAFHGIPICLRSRFRAIPASMLNGIEGCCDRELIDRIEVSLMGNDRKHATHAEDLRDLRRGSSATKSSMRSDIDSANSLASSRDIFS